MNVSPLRGGLNEGDVFVYAHTMTEVPSRRNPKFDVFKMAGKPATERVFIVVSRDPLQGVPIADELVAYCNTKAGPCPLSPTGTNDVPGYQGRRSHSQL